MFSDFALLHFWSKYATGQTRSTINILAFGSEIQGHLRRGEIDVVNRPRLHVGNCIYIRRGVVDDTFYVVESWPKKIEEKTKAERKFCGSESCANLCTISATSPVAWRTTYGISNEHP